jgi:hypothetical protein
MSESISKAGLKRIKTPDVSVTRQNDDYEASKACKSQLQIQGTI